MAHVKAVPGRKTEVRDAEWIADPLCHGLHRTSFFPSRPERELRELTRYRLIVIACAILARSATFTDLGVTYFDARDRAQVRRRIARRLETLGCQVSVSPLARELSLRHFGRASGRQRNMEPGPERTSNPNSPSRGTGPSTGRVPSAWSARSRRSRASAPARSFRSPGPSASCRRRSDSGCTRPRSTVGERVGPTSTDHERKESLEGDACEPHGQFGPVHRREGRGTVRGGRAAHARDS